MPGGVTMMSRLGFHLAEWEAGGHRGVSQLRGSSDHKNAPEEAWRPPTWELPAGMWGLGPQSGGWPWKGSAC